VSEDKRSERAERVLVDPMALLSQVLLDDDRHLDMLNRQCFRLRGVAWFRRRLGQGGLVVTDCDDEKFIKAMFALLKKRDAWRKKGFNLAGAKFSGRQLINALSKKRTPLSLQKAVMCIVLCEAILMALRKKDSSQPPGHAVYDHMCIEPAVSYLPGLEKERVHELLKNPQFVASFRAHTGQKRQQLLLDMANGLTVTETRAWRVYEVLKKFDPSGMFGPPESQYDADRSYKASETEDVTVDERKLPSRSVTVESAKPDDTLDAPR